MGGLTDNERSFADELERLNALLGKGISFELLPAAGGVEAAGRGRVSEEGLLCSSPASGVLTLGRAGREVAAARPLPLPRGRRERLLALASCLAECAMDLGLGAAVYRSGSLTPGACRNV